MFSTNVFVWIVMPWRLRPRSTSFEMSASSVGRTRSSASNSVTVVPSRAYAEAISAPDAPAPTTARLAGLSGRAQASSVPMTRPPNSVPGIDRATDPVASTIALAAIWLPSAVTVPDPASAPSPSINSMPFFLNSPATPPVRVLITFSRRAMTPLQSTSGSPTLIPKSPASLTSARTSATRSTALAGMQA